MKEWLSTRRAKLGGAMTCGALLAMVLAAASVPALAQSVTQVGSGNQACVQTAIQAEAGKVQISQYGGNVNIQNIAQECNIGVAQVEEVVAATSPAAAPAPVQDQYEAPEVQYSAPTAMPNCDVPDPPPVCDGDDDGDLATAGAAAEALLAPAPVAEAQSSLSLATTKLTVPGLEDFSRFGTSVAISGNFAVVGAPFDDTAVGADAGAAYVFRRSGTTWTQEAMLTGGGAVGGDQFGTSVDIFSGSRGTQLVVGAPFDDNYAGTNAGTASVFTRTGTTWEKVQTLFIPPPNAGRGTNDRFGSSATIARSDVLIGVPWDESPGLSESGLVTAFYRPAHWDVHWDVRSSLTAGASAGNFELFGTAVEMSGLTAVVGAPEDDQNGSAFVFVRPDDAVSPWTLQARLTSGSSAGNDFGRSVAVSGDVLFVGDPTVSSFFGEGFVYTFQRVGTVWQKRQGLYGQSFDSAFGRSVAIEGTSVRKTAIVGAPDTNQRTGEAFVYRQSGSDFSLQNTITAPDASTTDKFGYDVDLSDGGSQTGTTALIGAPNDNDVTGGTDNGSAYVVSVP
jgi:hypothetical protein